MGSMHASHGGRGAVAWGGQHAKHTAWQSNEIILAGGYHAKAIDRLVQCMKCWGAGAITESSAPPPLLAFYFFCRNFTSVVEVVGRLRFDEPLQGFVRTGVGMRTRAHFVGPLIHEAIAIWQGVEDDEIQINLLLAVAVLGC